MKHDLGGCLTLKLLSDVVLFLERSPEVTDEALVLPFHLVEGLVESLFLGQEHLVDVDGGGLTLLLTIVRIRDFVEVSELLLQECSGSIVNVLGIFDGVLDLLNFAWNGGNFRKFISISRERIANFLNLVSDVVSVPEDDDVDGFCALLFFG